MAGAPISNMGQFGPGAPVRIGAELQINPRNLPHAVNFRSDGIAARSAVGFHPQVSDGCLFSGWIEVGALACMLGVGCGDLCDKWMGGVFF